MRLREDDDAPGCLPGVRPERVRDARFFAGFFPRGASDDGGRGEFDESAEIWRFNSAISSPRARTTRSSSATCPVTTANMRFSSPYSARNAAFSARNPEFSARSAAFSTASRSSGARSGTTTPCPTPAIDQLDTPKITPHQPHQPRRHQLNNYGTQAPTGEVFDLRSAVLGCHNGLLTCSDASLP
jgi:hypothetical protein